MKNRFNLFLCVLFFSFGIINAQTSGKINGKIEVSASKDKEEILVSLLLANDNSLVQTQISAPNKSFEFNNLKNGTYLVEIDNLGYKNFKSEVITIDDTKNQFKLPAIVLTAAAENNLKEVIVKKKKSFVENKIDRMVVNVDALISNAGGDAMDVLIKVPGITVNPDGTIVFKGKSGVAVYIDDKPTYLSGADLEAYLKALPAGTLDKIELMTNPPAKYDAAGGAGVINIITKKSKIRGFNGNLTSRISQGINMQSRQGLSLNYLNDNIRIFGNIGYATQDQFTDLYIFRRFKNEDLTTKSLFDQYSLINRKAKTTNIKIGLDYYVSQNTTFGIGISGIYKSSDINTKVRSVLSDANSVLDSTIIANNSEIGKFKNADFNLNIRHNLDTIGQKISADFDYLNYDTKTNQEFNNYMYQPDGSLSNQDELLGYLPSDISIYSLKTDYYLPLKNEGSLEAGYKSSFSRTDNIADYRYVIDGNEVQNFETTNHFKYDEIINAVYVNLNTNYKRFTFQTGLRLENTQSNGNQLGNAFKPALEFKNNYTNLFPTVYIKYKLDSIGNNQLVVNYGKRINRPYFQDLNPFISPLDKFTYYSGNPYLMPSFANNYELSYRHKENFSTAISYGYNVDEINETIEINDGVYFSRPSNISESKTYSINVNGTIEFNSWWSANVYSELTNSHFESKLYTENLNSSGTYWYFSMNNSFKFKNDWSAELFGTYQTDVVSSQFVLLSRWNANIGVQKKILKGKGSLKLAFNDIFYSNINNGIINNLKLTDATWRNKPDSRFVALTFTYGFGKTFKPKSEHEATGADSEKDRVKG